MSARKNGARWYARLHGQREGAALDKACEAWRMESEEHERAFREIADLASACDQLRDDPQIRAARQDVLRKSFRKPPRRLARAAAIAASVVLCAGLVTIYASQRFAPPTPEDSAPVVLAESAVEASPLVYQTRTGERSVVTLVDGSVVTMNTGTKFRTDYTDGQRTIMLLEGQAIFKVAKDEDRPFKVLAGNRVVTALGTEFEVRADDESLSVTLLEGRVAVSEIARSGTGNGAQGPGRPIDLAPGERLEFVAGQAPALSQPDMGKAVSWREGRLEFEDERLVSAIEEFNRYSRKKLVLADPSLGDLRVGGSFRTDSLANFVLALETLYPVVAVEDEQSNEIRLFAK